MLAFYALFGSFVISCTHYSHTPHGISQDPGRKPPPLSKNRLLTRGGFSTPKSQIWAKIGNFFGRFTLRNRDLGVSKTRFFRRLRRPKISVLPLEIMILESKNSIFRTPTAVPKHYFTLRNPQFWIQNTQNFAACGAFSPKPSKSVKYPRFGKSEIS